MTRARYGISWAAAAVLCLGGAVFGAALLGGCASERAVLTSAPGLTQEALRDGGLAVVGVTVLEEVEQVRPPLIEALENVLRGSRPDLPFRTAASVRDSLGLAEYRRLLAAYQLEGKLSGADLGVLSSRLGGRARFALLARVDKDAIHLPPTRRASMGSSVPSDIGRTWARRDARVRVTLYDLSNGREALSAIYASSSENVLPDSVPRIHNKLLLPPGGDPEAPIEPIAQVPSLAQAVLEGFRAFAADLPPPPRAAAPPDSAKAK